MPDPTRAELLVAAALDHMRDELGGLTDAFDVLQFRARSFDLHEPAYKANCLSQARLLLGDGWQPMDSAPEDGTTILLWSEYMSEPCTGAWGTQNLGRLGWNAQHDGMPVVESEHDLSGTTYKEIAVATHWRRLPAPPSEKSNADKESGT